MQPLVQSAIDAANRGENNKALELCKQALAADPNDVDAWLVVAAVVEQPERKRQCLNRVLSLDPTNQIARDELLDMDRAALGGAPPSVPEPLSESVYQPAPPPPGYPTSTSAFEPAPEPQRSAPVASQSQAKVAPKPTPNPRLEKPLVFKYSVVTRVMVYAGIVLFAFLSLIGLVKIEASCIPCGLLLLMLPALWIVSGQVELSEKGIRTSRLFGLTSSQVGWNDIASLKSSSNSLDLTTKKGNRVKVTSQVGGYPVIIERLRQKRPDLFGAASVSPSSEGRNIPAPDGYEQTPSSGYSSSAPAAAPAFSGAKTFRKSFFKQYIPTIASFFFCLLFVWLGFAEPETRTAAFITAAACVFLMIFPLFQVNAIKVEPNKLIIETLFEQKAFSASQIREIKMQSIRGRYGRVTNFVNVIPVKGKNYPLQGFSTGDEVIYGFLTNWWNTYRNR